MTLHIVKITYGKSYGIKSHLPLSVFDCSLLQNNLLLQSLPWNKYISVKTTNSTLLIQYMCVFLILYFTLLRIYPEAKVCLQGSVIKTSIIIAPNFKQQAEVVHWYMYIV